MRHWSRGGATKLDNLCSLCRRHHTFVHDAGIQIVLQETGAFRFEATRVVDPVMMDSTQKSLRRYGEPDEIADAVAFLAGPESKFISGQVLRVDGGETLFPG